MSFSHLNCDNLFGSIEHFTRLHTLLLEEQKKEFLENLDSHVTAKAYQDENYAPEAKDYILNQDIENIFDEAEQIGLSNKFFYIYRLLANTEKISATGLPIIQSFLFHQLIVFKEDGKNYWGWIQAKYLRDTKLIDFLKEGKVILESSAFKPSILFALQWVQSALMDKKEASIEMTISFQPLFDLILFANEWHMTELLKDIRVILLAIDIEKRDPKILKEFETTKKFNPTGLIENLMIDSKLEGNRTALKKEIVFNWPADGSEKSHFFNEKDFFGSMIRFTERGCTLSFKEQKAFYSHLRYFSTIAYDQKTLKLTSEQEKEFTEKTLPFFLDTPPHPHSERQRLLACIKLIAGREFGTLAEEKNIQIVENSYSKDHNRGQIGWIPSPEKNEECLNIYKIETDTLLPFAYLNDHTDIQSTISPKEASQLLAFILGQSNPLWLKRIHELILNLLKHPDYSTEMSNLLVSFLKNKNFLIIFEKIPSNYFKPQTHLLEKQDLLILFSFYAEKEKEVSLYHLIQKYLEPSKHLDFILENFETNASKEQSKTISKYYLKRLLNKVPQTPRKHRENVLKDFLEKLLALIESEEIDNKPSKKFEEESKKYSLEKEDLYLLYNFLKSEETTFDLKKAGLSHAQNLIEALITNVCAELLVNNMIDRFVEKFFPDEMKNRSFKELFEKVLKLATNSSYPYKNKKLKQDYQLSDALCLKIHSVLESNETEKWLSKENSHISFYCVKRIFEETFHIKFVNKSIELKKNWEKTDNNNKRAEEKKFLFSTFKFFSEITGEREKRKLYVLAKLQNIWAKVHMDSSKSNCLKEFLLLHEVKDIYEKENLAFLYPLQLLFLEKKEEADRVAELFIRSFKISKHNIEETKRLISYCFVAEEAADGGSFEVLKINQFGMIELASLLTLSKTKVFLSEQKCSSLKSFIYGSINNKFEGKLSIEIEKHQFLKKIEAENQDWRGSSFLRDILGEFSKVTLEEWENKNKEEMIEQKFDRLFKYHILETIDIYDKQKKKEIAEQEIVQERIKILRKILNNREYTSILTEGSTPKLPEYLLSKLPEESSCIIS